MSVSRREFLRVSASGSAMILAVSMPSKVFAKSAEEPNSNQSNSNQSNWNVYIKIDKNNTIEIASPVQEMGQHMKTTGPMLLVEELDADWSKVSCVPAETHLMSDPDNTKNVKYQYAYMSAGGSHSVRRNWEYLRSAGAVARQLLILAAAKLWNCSADEITTKNSYLYHQASKRKLAYGKVVEIAATLTPPEKKPILKSMNDFKLIGQSTTTVDIDEIVTGKPLFGIDTDLKGQLHAVIARCPYNEGRVKNLDAKAALASKDVLKVFKIDALNEEGRKITAEGVVVVAKSYWAALKAKRKLKIEWENGNWREESASSMESSFRQLTKSKETGRIQREDGDLTSGFKQSSTVLEAEYFMPYFHHACMEPFNCIADVKENKARIITGHQFPDKVAKDVANYTGLDPLSISIENRRMGGGLGRRWQSDYVIEAAIISQKIQAPVKVTWSREDEMEQGFYAPMIVSKIKAGLDKSNRIIAWHYREAKKSGGARAECFPANLIPNYQVESLNKACGTPTGAWRGPGHLQFAFAVESMTDELAHAMKVDPLQIRKDLYQGKGKFPYQGYGATEIDADRMWACYQSAAKMAKWDSPRKKGIGLGIAGHFTFGSYAAFVVEVDAREQDNFRVTRCWGAIDCGLAVNPNHIENQMQGGFIDGLNAAMFNQVDIENGRVTSNNFHQLPFVRMATAPFDIGVDILKTDYPPTGVGEPPTAPAAAALANALFDATGKRLRKLPLSLGA